MNNETIRQKLIEVLMEHSKYDSKNHTLYIHDISLQGFLLKQKEIQIR